MARDRDDDSTSPTGGQSKQPPVTHRGSDSQSDTTNTSPQTQLQAQQQQHHAPPHQRQPASKQSHHHGKHHHVGRHHPRVPSSKALHKQHGPPGAKLTRRITSPPSETESSEQFPRLSAGSSGGHVHRRATSEIKLPRGFSATSASNTTATTTPAASSVSALPKSASQSNLKRNRSHVEVGKRTRSSDKLKRSASGTNVVQHRATKALQKGQVHFDLGDDEQEGDEWVDASGSNSPYLSRKASIAGSAQSSTPANGSRPETPNDSKKREEAAANTLAKDDEAQDDDDEDNKDDDDDDESPDEPRQKQSSPERERVHHRQYLTSRLLQRTPSHGAPPQMSADTALVNPPQMTPESTKPDSLPLHSSGSKDELTSRFVAAPGSGGMPSEGSFYQHERVPSRRSEEIPQRPRSAINLQHLDTTQGAAVSEVDNSALTPRAGRRGPGPSAESSRIQQKLNLQRASSVIEPGQAVGGGVGGGGLIGASPLIGVGGAGHDGGNSRDPRVGKLLERTGMEYLVVRRYQNPIARSIGRLAQLPDKDKPRRIGHRAASSTASSASVARALSGGAASGQGSTGKRSLEYAAATGHARNVSAASTLESQRRPATPTMRRGASSRANGAASSVLEGSGSGAASTLATADEYGNERLSGSSLVGGSDEDGTHALLRNLWEKPMDLAASTD